VTQWKPRWNLNPRLAVAVCLLAALWSGRLGAQTQIDLVEVASGLTNPVAATHAGDGSGRIFITLQDGRIMIFDGQQVLPTPFLNIMPAVACCGERGLFSVAFHPDYPNNGRFFVNYSRNDGDTVIERFQVSATDANVANPNSRLVLMTIGQPFTNHNGGQIQFGPDGFLYIATGDGGSGGDPNNLAQDLGSLLGKMLRIDVDSGSPYAIPASNPYVGVAGARDEIWSYGLRNPWRFSFDRLTGDVFIGDVGQSAVEEISFQAAASTGNENYGWRLMEGSQCFNPSSNCNPGGLVLPILEYDHTLGCSVTGGYRYRGPSASLFGTYFYADYCTGRIWGATEGGGS